MDHTLVDTEIEKEVKKNSLIFPFDINNLRGASYDLSVGTKAVIATPDSHDWKALDEQKVLVLPPSRTCVIASLEKVRIPANMTGRLSLRSHYALQRLEYNGGVIDPGYNGYLFFTLANLGDSPIEIKFKEAIITVEFIRLEKTAKHLYNNGKEILRLEDRQQIPRLPPLPKLQYDPIDLSKRVQELENSFSKLESDLDKFQPSLQVTEDIVQSLILASVAGVVAGLVLFIIPHLNQYPVNFVFIAGFIIFIALIIASAFRRAKRKKK